jgi:ABC-2 type transport system permease protein
MNMRRIRAVSRKEYLHIARDARSLAMGIAIPVMLLLLFGYALTLDVDDVRLMVLDRSRTPVSRDLVARFDASRYFTVAGHAASYGDIERAIDRGDALVGLVIPSNFASHAGRGERVPLQLLVDGSDANTAAIAIGYAEGVVGTLSREVAIREIRRAGGTKSAGAIDLRSRVWFNADMESKNYIVPGLTAVIMMVIAALLTSLTIAREWESGTMEQLISTPLRGVELIVGKLFPYFTIGMLDVVVAVAMAEWLFRVPLRGNVLQVFATGAIFLIGALSLGLLISIVTKSQLVASQLAMVATFLPAFLLSGFMYDIANMPRVIQAITYAVPARYYVSLLKGIYLKGIGPTILWTEAAFLAAFAAVVFALATARFRKKLV